MSENRRIKHPFGAVIDKNCKIIILGSVPSVKSVEYNFYYMHKQNKFWKVMGNLLDYDLYNADIETRKQVLLANHIALYDAVEECDIVGSSDSKISNIVPSDIKGFMSKSNIQTIFCAGNKSYEITTKYNPDLLDKIIKLPSTSPANAKYTVDKLVDEWSIILDYIR